jgi:hypothetical protein
MTHVHSIYDAADCKNVIFTDEITVQLNHHTDPFVRRRKDEKIRPVHCRDTKTFARKVFLWAPFLVMVQGALFPSMGR